jgi:predicted RecA/RadA family phage recombinase
MAKNKVQDGRIVTVLAPANKLSGAGVKVGQIFGVAQQDALSGASIDIEIGGVYDLPKVGSQAWAVGDLVYWDDGNSRCTKTAAGSLLIGTAYAVVGSGAGETTGRVLLDGTARATEAP